MAKKNFSQGIDAILGLGNHKSSSQSKSVDAQQDLIRTTFRMEPDLMEQIKALAYWERLTTTQVISKALKQFLDSQEKKVLEEAIHQYKSSIK